MFGIFKTYRDVKKGIHDPGALGQELALDVIKGPVVLITIIAVLFFIALGLLAFTGSLGGPYTFFKIVFFILLFPFIIFEIVVWAILGKIEKIVTRARQKISEKAKVIDAEVL